MPDATGLELIAQELREAQRRRRSSTPSSSAARATLVVEPAHDRATCSSTLRGKGYSFLASLHGVDYYPEEPRLGVHYELLDMARVDRITVKLRVPSDDPRRRRRSSTGWPTADHQEREVYDMFGVVFDGHPTCAGS